MLLPFLADGFSKQTMRTVCRRGSSLHRRFIPSPQHSIQAHDAAIKFQHFVRLNEIQSSKQPPSLSNAFEVAGAQDVL